MSQKQQFFLNPQTTPVWVTMAVPWSVCMGFIFSTKHNKTEQIACKDVPPDQNSAQASSKPKLYSFVVVGHLVCNNTSMKVQLLA